MNSLPTHPEAERALLNALFTMGRTEPGETLTQVEASRLQGDDFCLPAHADTFRAMLPFLQRGEALEFFPLLTALQCSGPVRREGGQPWLSELLLVPTGPEAGAFAGNAKLVREAGATRHASLSLQATAAKMLEPGRVLEKVLQEGAEAYSLLNARTLPLEDNSGSVQEAVEAIYANSEGRRPSVVRTGIRGLDEQIGGLQVGILTLVGALPGVGKSTLLATVALNLAQRGVRVGFFSLEDERTWLTNRWISFCTGIPVFRLLADRLSADELAAVNAAAAEVHNLMRNLFVDDRQGLTPAEVVQVAADMVINKQVRVLMVDHLGELRLSRTERYDLDIAEALGALRHMAKRHRVPVLVASHVRRRDGKGIADPPSLTDFANSSAPERMARVALGLSKPDDSTLTVTVLKQTNGKSCFAVDLRIVQHAAMLDCGPQLKVVSNE